MSIHVVDNNFHFSILISIPLWTESNIESENKYQASKAMEYANSEAKNHAGISCNKPIMTRMLLHFQFCDQTHDIHALYSCFLSDTRHPSATDTTGTIGIYCSSAFSVIMFKCVNVIGLLRS